MESQVKPGLRLEAGWFSSLVQLLLGVSAVYYEELVHRPCRGGIKVLLYDDHLRVRRLSRQAEQAFEWIIMPAVVLELQIDRSLGDADWLRMI